VLDEPTNHLDLATKEMLITALKDFEGTMLFVSHDRSFLRGLSNRVLELGGESGTDAQPHAYNGSYLEYAARTATKLRCPSLRPKRNEEIADNSIHLPKESASMQMGGGCLICAPLQEGGTRSEFRQTRSFDIVAGPVPVTIDDVIQRMEKIDTLLPVDDGLKWFNRLYLYVTSDVKLHHSQDLWKNPPWLTRLDVIFAGFYFAAVDSAIRQTGAAPKSWQVLFESRHQQGIDRIQFALAGMNAHINHDLALALLQVDAEFHRSPGQASPEPDDYERVNGLLEEVVPTALTFLATGILGLVAESTGKQGVGVVPIAGEALGGFPAAIFAVFRALRAMWH
jgi:hypothetical protein